MSEQVELESAEERHNTKPDTLWIPHEYFRERLQPGDHARVIFKVATHCGGIGGERIWLTVTRRVGDLFIGVLVRNPSSAPVQFRIEHVIDIEWQRTWSRRRASTTAFWPKRSPSTKKEQDDEAANHDTANRP